MIEKIRQIREKIMQAAEGRNVQLVAVTKTVEPEHIEEAYRAGVKTFGENRIQEALPKIEALTALSADWHFIGHLQTNKARDAVRFFSWIQSIDSHKLLMQVEKEASKQQKHINLLLELNLGNEESKHGLSETDLPEVLQTSQNLQWSKVCGFMIIPPFQEDPENVRHYFRTLRGILERWQKEFPTLTELSMGMSHDYEVAVEEGATMVRIGTAIFGERPAPRSDGVRRPGL